MSSSSTNDQSVRLRLIQYWINWLSSGFADGRWESLYRGRGFDFQDTVPFDDDPDMVRINWPATVASGELQVTQYSEERDICVCLLADLAPSMAFGSSFSKQSRMATLAALIAFSAIRLRDNFQFIGYTDRVEESNFPRTRDRSYPLMLARSIAEFDCPGAGRGGSMQAALSVPDQKSLVIMVSDFLGDLSELDKVLKALAPVHQVLPIVLWDEREVSLPNGWGFYPMRELGSGELRFLLLTPGTRRKFAENSRRRMEKLESIFRRYGIRPHFMCSGTSEDDIDALMKLFFAQRGNV